jgi:hypothetical protein
VIHPSAELKNGSLIKRFDSAGGRYRTAPLTVRAAEAIERTAQIASDSFHSLISFTALA